MPSKRAFRVLVVDDCKDTADSFAVIVRSLGHEARVAYGNSDALEAAGAFQPQVVLMDLVLPETPGSELARVLRQQPGMDKTIFIAVSGHDKEVQKQFWSSPLFEGHLVKPVDPDELRRLLEAEETLLKNENSPTH